MNALRRIVGLLVLLLPLAGCAGEPSLPTVSLKGVQYQVEIADELPEQTQGMMFRRELAADRGMLFVYAQAQSQAFWMRNCHIALDILFFDAQGRFINGHYSAPPCNSGQCPTYDSQRPARYVLELAGGVGRALGLKEGDPLTLPQLPAG